MKKSSLLFLILTLTALIVAQQKPSSRTQPAKTAEQSQELGWGKFTGSLFNDFFYVLNEPQPGNVATGISGRNASVMRRAMFGYEYSFNKDISAKVVYDGSANVLTQGYAEIKNLGPMMDLKVGLSQTLSSEVVEKMWDYRSLEATVLDKKGMTNEFDMGLTLTGRTNAQGTMYARLAVYNGSGVAAENDKLKKLAMVIGNWFDKYSVLELYVDYENVGGGRSTVTTKLFFGMNASKFTVGGEGFYRMNRKFAGTKDVTPVGGSVFGWYEVMKSLRAVARVDAVEDDLNVTTGYREIYFNGGVDYAPVSSVHLIPNLAYVKSMKKGGAVPVIADYMMVRLTTSVYFK